VCEICCALIGQLRLGMDGDCCKDIVIRRRDAVLRIVHKIKSTFHG
jgi:hypothetical protein